MVTPTNPIPGNPQPQGTDDAAAVKKREDALKAQISRAQIRGNTSQKWSAVFSVLTFGVAAYGVWSTVPFFQVKLLTEEKAKLTMEMTQLTQQENMLTQAVSDLRKKAWFVTCNLASTSATSGFNLFSTDLRDYERGILLDQPSTTYKNAISNGLGKADLSALRDEEKEEFRMFAKAYSESLPEEYNQSTAGKALVGPKLSSEPAERFEAACEKALPVYR